MSETADYDPGPWKGYDFDSAKKQYDAYAGRSYGDALNSDKKVKDVLPEEITTQSTSPLVIACDVTGSMKDWPATIFSKLPYLELEGQQYLGKDMEISFGAIGDAYTDKYPLQVRDFTKGVDLKKRLKELVIEAGGGGQIMESYELAALYYARNVRMGKAIRPILIMIGDEAPYDYVNPSQAKTYARLTLEKRLSTEEIFNELKKKFEVFLVRKPYEETNDNSMSVIDKRVHGMWAKLLGEDHICILPEANRVVDVIFGILARVTNSVDYFKTELEGRQKPDQVDTVYKSLETVHAASSKARASGKSGRSVTHKPSTGKDADYLI